jgi:hypothetical protein
MKTFNFKYTATVLNSTELIANINNYVRDIKETVLTTNVVNDTTVIIEGYTTVNFEPFPMYSIKDLISLDGTFNI